MCGLAIVIVPFDMAIVIVSYLGNVVVSFDI
jgi:hypothetical protein